MIQDREFENVIALAAPQRYEHLVKRLADSQELWALNSPEGWLLLGDDEGNDAFPIWPAERYAAAFGDAAGCSERPERLDLSRWTETMLPELASDGVLVAAFPTPVGAGIVLSPLEHLAPIAEELEKYA